jgi:hypothetical protein
MQFHVALAACLAYLAAADPGEFQRRFLPRKLREPPADTIVFHLVEHILLVSFCSRPYPALGHPYCLWR